MKRKLPLLTRLARLILLIAIILQVLILVLQYSQYFQSDSLQSLAGNFVNLIGLEFYFALTESVVFRRLFLEQATGKVHGWFGWLIMLLFFGVIDCWGTIQTLLRGGRPAPAELLAMTVHYAAPILILLAIAFGSRLLSLLAIFGRLLMTLWNLYVLIDLRIVMSETAVAAMLLIELLEGLGIIVGLLGILFQPAKTPEPEKP